MVDSVYDRAEFVLHSLFHRQPVQLLERRCDRVDVASIDRRGERRHSGHLCKMLTVDASNKARTELQ